MASSSDIKAQIAVIPNSKCQLCDENQIRWKCVTCNEYICSQCRKVHLKGKATKGHNITSTEGADKSSNSDRIYCSKHPTEDVIMFCQDCINMICKDCIASGSHKNHSMEKIEDIIDKKQKELEEIIEESNTKLSLLEIETQSLKEVSHNHSKDITECIRKVNSKNVVLKSTVDQITNRIITKLKEIERQNHENFEKREKRIDKDKSVLKEIITRCKEKQHMRETALVEFVETVKPRLRKLKPPDPLLLIKIPEFVTKDTDVHEIESLFGDLDLVEETSSDFEKLETPTSVSTSCESKEKTPTTNTHEEEVLCGDLDLDEEKSSDHERAETSISTSSASHATDTSSSNTSIYKPKHTEEIKPIKNAKVISTFSVEGTDIVASIGDTQAWIGRCVGRDITQITSDGNVVHTVETEFGVYDMAVTESRELLLTVYAGSKVKKLTSAGKFIDLYQDLDGYHTQGITVTDNNDIILGLYKLDGTSKSKVVQLSPTGKLKMTLDYDKDGKTLLFGNPWHVSCNRNSDVIVSQDGNEVVHVDKSGNKRFTYTGNQVKGLKKPCNLLCTVTDRHGNILISDASNFAVHLLDQDGNFLQLLITDKHGLEAPAGLSIDQEKKLWVCDEGKKQIMIVKYI